MDTSLLKTSWACKCPKCRTGDLYQSRFDLSLKDTCDTCGLELHKNDSADGPAVFLMFVLGFLIVPIALIVDSLYSWHIWLHACVWTAITLILILVMLRQVKAYIIALQYKHRPNDWK